MKKHLTITSIRKVKVASCIMPSIGMIRIFFTSLVLLAFLFPWVRTGSVAYAEGEEYVWVLVDEVDDRGTSDLEKIDAQLKKYREAGAEGEFFINSTLNNTGYFVDYSVQKTFADMNSAAEATISTTPLEIKPDTNISLNLRVKVIENEGYKGKAGDTSAGASVSFCGKNSTPQDFVPPVLGDKPFYDNEFKSESGERAFSSNEANAYPMYDTIIFGSLPAGTTHGEAIAICAEVNLVGVGMGTVYYYRWLPSGSDDLYGINKKYEVLKDNNGDYVASGIRISDISGEVYVRRGDADRGEWEMLNLEDVIYEGDVIHTKDRNSRCTLALPDLTTFNLRPRSVIILNTRSEQESPFSILTGKVMVNLKKMIKEGTMDVEMSQAIAGARGTIFVLETDDKISSVKVLEGKVEMKSTNGESVLLSAGEYAIAEEGVLQNKETFALGDELNGWDETIRKEIIADIIERTGKEPNLESKLSGTDSDTANIAQEESILKKSFSYWYVLIGLLVVAGGFLWYSKR